jgi:hypothetical protein
MPLSPGPYTYMIHAMQGDALSEPSNEATVQIPGGAGGAGAGGSGGSGGAGGVGGLGGSGGTAGTGGTGGTGGSAGMGGAAGTGGTGGMAGTGGTGGTAGTGGTGGTGGSGGTGGAGMPLIGDPCTAVGGCPTASAGTAVCLTAGHPGGYCSIDGCNPHANDCPGTASCVVDPTAICRASCGAGVTCRMGYTCAVRPTGHSSAMVCVPS